MSNMGVFGWIRESVRRSVLLGFSDAVEQLGVAADSSEAINPQMAAVLRQAPTATLAHMPQDSAPQGKQSRKRLGRSLEQLRQPGNSRAHEGHA